MQHPSSTLVDPPNALSTGVHSAPKYEPVDLTENLPYGNWPWPLVL
jgi:hypothetical protein